MRRRLGPARVPWGFALAGLLAGATGARGQAPAPEVREVRWEGNGALPTRLLASSIVTRASRCRSVLVAPLCWVGAGGVRDVAYLDGTELRRDVLRLRLLYYRRGYREAEVDTLVSREDGAVRVTFRIREGRPVLVEALEVSVEEAADLPADLTRSLPLRAGEPLDLERLEAARDTLLSRLRNRGFARADVLTEYRIPRDDPGRARVALRLYPGPRARFGQIRVEGTRRLAPSVVERMLPFRRGDLFREDLLLQGQRNLYALEIVRHATIRALPGPAPDTAVPILVQVNEGELHRVRTGVGVSTAECVNGEGRWTSRNFLGGARRLQLRGRISNLLAPAFSQILCTQSGRGIFGRVNWLLGAEFHQPWLLSPRYSLSASLFAERQSLPGIFVRRAWGANVALVRSLGARTTLTLAYRPQLVELLAADIFFCSSFFVCNPEDVRELQRANWLAPLALNLSTDRRNDPFSPTYGYTAVIDVEHASRLVGSDFGYNRVIAEVAGYWELAPGWVLAGRLRPGWLEPRPFGGLSERAGGVAVVHPQKRFYAGGSNSVRGYAQNQLGPRVLTVPADTLVAGADPPCTPDEVNGGTCDASPLAEGAFSPRPVGGSVSLEWNGELRFPVAGRRVRGALFVDLGQVWRRAGEVELGGLRVTPGVGLRYFTPFGPIRLDVAYRPRVREPLPVITSRLRPFDPERDRRSDLIVTPDGGEWVATDELVLLGPPVPYGGGGGFLDRLQVHLSIGQAF